MDPGVLSAISALTGTAIGAMSSLGSTWMTTTSQARAAKLAAERDKREGLYGRFMDQLAKLYAAGLKQVGVDYEHLSDAYALAGRIALYASPEVNEAAKAAMRFIVDLATGPVRSDAEMRELMDRPDADIIGAFANACRQELAGLR
ncbi:MAG: hypothetical protein HZY79_13350 [Rhodoblastus sp.]|nr:MAG: hypothetical protein HZY79_13350 [Rhodoblastus sp.]